MRVIEFGGKNIKLDDEGYLIDPEQWNEKIACSLAVMEGVTRTCPLTSEQIRILKFMREYYKKFKAFLIPSAICKNINLPEKCVINNFQDPIKAWKVAGLPKLRVVRTR